MTKFINNVNAYMDAMKIKQSFVSLVSQIEKSKLSRILNGMQAETGEDMEKLAAALGKDIRFFLSDTANDYKPADLSWNRVAFYAGNPTEKQKQAGEQLIELLENIDAVIGAKTRFEHIGE